MSVTPTEFKAEFTEFSSLTDQEVEVKLNEAYLRVGEIWSELRDHAAKLITAHLLWTSPLSEPSARAAGSPYMAAYQELLSQARVAFFATVANEGG